MGTKEETAPIIIVKGYSGQLRPGQVKAGKCVACKAPVYVEAPREKPEVRSGRVRFFHWSCSA